MVRARPFLLALVAAALLAAPASGNRVAASQQWTLDRQLLAQVNAVRASHGLRPLRLSHPLSAAADSHSLEMAERGFFSHSSADGTSFSVRIGHYYPAPSSGTWTVGENLVWESPALAARDAIRMWMASAPHRANLLSPAWREIGIAAVRSRAAPGVFRGRPTVVVTADFGARTPSG